MKRNLLALILTSFLIPAAGCTMCCAPFDYEYNAYGGRYDRVDRVNGRAGSRFEPAQAIDRSQTAIGKPPVEAEEAAELTNESPNSADAQSTSNDRYE